MFCLIQSESYRHTRLVFLQSALLSFSKCEHVSRFIDDYNNCNGLRGPDLLKNRTTVNRRSILDVSICLTLLVTRATQYPAYARLCVSTDRLTISLRLLTNINSDYTFFIYRRKNARIIELHKLPVWS